MTLIVTAGLTTMFNWWAQSFVPSLSKKYPALMDFFDSSKVRKDATEFWKGSTIYPYCPGKIVPKFNWFGNFNNDLVFISNNIYKKVNRLSY